MEESTTMSDNHNEAPENCTHDCSTCGEVCAQHEPESLQQPLRPGSRVDKVCLLYTSDAADE